MTLVAVILVLLAGALLGARLLAAVPRPPGRLPERLGPQRPHRRPPGDLMRITDLVTGGLGSAADVHRRVRPLLREIAAGRLAGRGISLERDPEAARALLGDGLWELVRPGRPLPSDPRGPGLDRAALVELVDRLETV